jgi:hypothetical protein
MNQSTKINLIGCDTIVNSPSFFYFDFELQAKCVLYKSQQKCKYQKQSCVFVWFFFVLKNSLSHKQMLKCQRIQVGADMPSNDLPDANIRTQFSNQLILTKSKYEVPSLAGLSMLCK